jgi:drug/metabolite transporter (DMT)-like permease
MMKETATARTAALAAAVLFGASAPLAKLLLEDTGPLALASLLYLGSGAGLALLFLISRFRRSGRQPRETPLKLSDLGWLAGGVLAGSVAAPMLLMLSLDVTPAATASLLLNFEAAATMLIAAGLFHEAVGRRAWMAAVLITTAGVLLAWEPSEGFLLAPGALGIIATCVLWGLDNNLTCRIAGRDPLAIAGIKSFAGGVILAFIASAGGEAFPALPASLPTLTVGFWCYGISIVLFILSLRTIGAARTGALFATAPFWGVIFSFAIFGGIPDAAFLLSLPLMAAGTWLLIGEVHSHLHSHLGLSHDHRHAHDDLHHHHDHPEGAVPPGTVHAHPHIHTETGHEHPHTPDLHHGHDHEE